MLGRIYICDNGMIKVDTPLIGTTCRPKGISHNLNITIVDCEPTITTCNPIDDTPDIIVRLDDDNIVAQATSTTAYADMLDLLSTLYVVDALYVFHVKPSSTIIVWRLVKSLVKNGKAVVVSPLPLDAILSVHGCRLESLGKLDVTVELAGDTIYIYDAKELERTGTTYGVMYTRTPYRNRLSNPFFEKRGKTLYSIAITDRIYDSKSKRIINISTSLLLWVADFANRIMDFMAPGRLNVYTCNCGVLYEKGNHYALVFSKK